MKNELKAIEKIARHNKILIIKDKLIEEAKELAEAVEENVDEHIIEEIADVLIMIQQYLIMTDSEQELDAMIDFKLNRTMERLGIQ